MHVKAAIWPAARVAAPVVTVRIFPSVPESAELVTALVVPPEVAVQVTDLEGSALKTATSDSSVTTSPLCDTVAGVYQNMKPPLATSPQGSSHVGVAPCWMLNPLVAPPQVGEVAMARCGRAMRTAAQRTTARHMMRSIRPTDCYSCSSTRALDLAGRLA